MKHASATKPSSVSSLHKADDSAKKTTAAVTGAAKTAATHASHAASSINRAATGTARSAIRTGESVAATNRETAENVVRLGAGSMRSMMDSSADQAQKVKAKTNEYAQAGAQQFSAQAGKASRAMSEMASIGQGQMEALMECGNIAATMSKELSEEMFAYANDVFSKNVEISKDLFTCRTINDMFDLQNKMIKSNLDRFFSESSKISEMLFNYVNQASEPLNECMQSASERLSRSMAA